METQAPSDKTFGPSGTRSSDAVRTIMKDTISIPFPWREAVPSPIKEWFEAYAKSHNTAPVRYHGRTHNLRSIDEAAGWC